MKIIKRTITIVLSIILVVSCGKEKTRTKKQSIEQMIEKGNLSNLKKKREELLEIASKNQLQIYQLDEAITLLDQTSNIPLVNIRKIKDTLLETYIEVQGNIDTNQNILISSEYPGLLKKIKCKRGDYLKKGAVIGIIEDRGIKQQIVQQKVQMELSKTVYERQQNLWRQGIGSEIQYLEALTKYKALESSYEQMRKQFQKTVITAPFSGVVDDIPADEGMLVNVGTPIIRLVNMNQMHVKASVPEKYLSVITKGKKSSVYIPVLDKEYSNQIKQVGNFINPNNRTFEIEIDLANKDHQIKPNMTARVKLNNYINEQAILVKSNVILEDAQGNNFIYLANIIEDAENQAIVEKQIVKLGVEKGDYTEILTAIHSNGYIIEEGAKNIKNKQKVKFTNVK